MLILFLCSIAVHLFCHLVREIYTRSVGFNKAILYHKIQMRASITCANQPASFESQKSIQIKVSNKLDDYIVNIFRCCSEISVDIFTLDPGLYTRVAVIGLFHVICYQYTLCENKGKVKIRFDFENMNSIQSYYFSQ